MPLAPTDHRAATAPRERRLHRIAAALAGLTLLAAVAGCAEGTQRDARQGQDEDAERTSVVRDLQATRTARVLAGTPTPPPTASTGE